MAQIIRAVKAAQTEHQLEAALDVAKRAGIHGLEIQELPEVMEANPAAERAALVARLAKQAGITHLVYHYPFPLNAKNYAEAVRRYDLCAKDTGFIEELIQETINEAAAAASLLETTAPVLVNVHLLGYVGKKPLSVETHELLLKRGEKRLLELKNFAIDAAIRAGLGPEQMVIVRENNATFEQNGHTRIIDRHPTDLVRTGPAGIGINIDIAHFEMCRRYWQGGKGEAPGVAFASEHADTSITWAKAIELVAPYLRLMHLNDADSYLPSREGLEIGLGKAPHREIIPLVCKLAARDIVGTYELKGMHHNPERMTRSDAKYREWFGADFEKYFA